MTDNATEHTRHKSDGTHAATKSDSVIKLLSRVRGATLAEVCTATSWLPHSARAFLSSLRKKGRDIAKEERRNGEIAYRLTA